MISDIVGSVAVKTFDKSAHLVYSSSIDRLKSKTFLYRMKITLQILKFTDMKISLVTSFELKGRLNALYEFSSGDLAFIQGERKQFFLLNTYHTNLHLLRVDYSNVQSARELFVSDRRRLEIADVADVS